MFLNQVLLHVPCPIFWKNLQGEFLGCNDQFLKLCNFADYSQLVGKKDNDLPWHKYKDEYYKDDQDVISNGGAIMREEIIPLGEKVIISETTKTPLMQDNKIVGVLGICLDITDRKEKERLEIENKSQRAVLHAQENFKKMVGQMVHDIKTPLSTLQMVVQSTKEIPEEKRIVLRDSAIAIADISGELLRRFENDNAKDNIALEKRQTILVSTLLESVLSDARRRNKGSQIQFQFEISQLNAFTFIKAILSDIKRSLVNIINNASEAMLERKGMIEVRLTVNEEWVRIAILDDGSGIPEGVLKKIKAKESVSFGKEGGHGIGLSQVRDAVERNHGKLSIISSTHPKSHGTTVEIVFPRSLDPEWIIEELQLTKNDTIIILDDDKSIHGGWDSKLGHILEKLPTITVKHLYNGAETLQFIDSFPESERHNLCLFSDYELINQDMNGIDVIKAAKIKRSVLVTSHYTNLQIRAQAVESGIKILPKDLVYMVPIRVMQENVADNKVDVHMVFVDDDKHFIRTLISNFYSHLITESYANPMVFLEEVEKYPKDTRIILDNYYSKPDGEMYPIDGVEIAKRLHDNGYTNLFLLSGEKFAVPEYLTLILKSEAEKIGILNQLSANSEVMASAIK